MSARNTVMLKSFGEPAIESVVTAAILTPGELVDFDASNNLIAHASAAQNAQPMFLLENSEVGEGLSDNYASGETAKVWFPKAGDRVNALVAASAAAIVKGDPLESAGDGTVRLHSPPANLGTASPYYAAIVGFAAEDVDNSAGGSEARIAIYAR